MIKQDLRMKIEATICFLYIVFLAFCTLFLTTFH